MVQSTSELSTAGGYPFDIDMMLDTEAPILDIGPGLFDFSRYFRTYFAFVVEPDPACSRQLRSSMSFLQRAIVPKSKYGSVEYKADGLVTHVPAITLSDFAAHVGVERFSIIKLNCPDRNAILEELPGVLARQITLPSPTTEVAKRHLSQWYRETADGRLWVFSER